MGFLEREIERVVVTPCAPTGQDMDDTVDHVEQVREDGRLVISASNGFHRCVEHTGNGHSG